MLASSIAVIDDNLVLQVVVQPVDGELSANTALLEATPRCVDPNGEVRVDVDVTLLHVLSNVVCLLHVLSEYTASKAIHRIVGNV